MSKLYPTFTALNNPITELENIQAWRVTMCPEETGVEECAPEAFASERDCQRVIDFLATKGIVDNATYDELATDELFEEAIATCIPW